MHDFRSRARDCVSVARQKFTAHESVIKSPASSSTWKMSSLQHSLPSDDSSANFSLSVGVTAANVDESTGENVAVRDDAEGRKMNDGSLALDSDMASSSISTSNTSLGQDHERPCQCSSAPESASTSGILRDTAAELITLLDRLEARTLSTYEELQSTFVSEDTHNMVRLILEGFFFAQLWTDDILTFYRYVLLRTLSMR